MELVTTLWSGYVTRGTGENILVSGGETAGEYILVSGGGTAGEYILVSAGGLLVSIFWSLPVGCW